MKIKICGIRDEEELKLCSKYADSLGFVVEYPVEVPWNIERNKARELISMSPEDIESIVVTAGDMSKIKGIVNEVEPDTFQLHGDEGPDHVEDIVRYSNDFSFKVIKAIQIDVKTMKVQGREPLNVAKEYQEIGVDSILLDAKRKTNAGGTGLTLDWSELFSITDEIDVPVILAGGLNSDNVEEAIDELNPDGVDVISGVETEGKKDESKIKDFVKNAKVIG